MDISEKKACATPRHQGKHAQGPSTTSLYPANIGHGGAMGQREEVKGVWFGGGERGKDLFCGSCPSPFGRYVLLG